MQAKTERSPNFRLNSKNATILKLPQVIFKQEFWESKAFQLVTGLNIASVVINM